MATCQNIEYRKVADKSRDRILARRAYKPCLLLCETIPCIQAGLLRTHKLQVRTSAGCTPHDFFARSRLDIYGKRIRCIRERSVRLQNRYMLRACTVSRSSLPRCLVSYAITGTCIEKVRKIRGKSESCVCDVLVRCVLGVSKKKSCFV